MAPPEMQVRSALKQLLSGHGVIHGTLVRRQRVCGKPNCRCAKGHLHASLYLVVTEAGKGRQLYVPKPWEAVVREWIDNYDKARRLLEELSGLHWDKIRQRER